MRAGSAAAALAVAAVTFATPSVSAQVFYKGFGTDGVQPGENGVGAFYQHQRSAQARMGSPPLADPFAAGAPQPDPPPPAPIMPSYNPTWDDDGNPATPEVPRNWWEQGNGGWCGTTAWVNSFYFYDTHGFKGLFDHSALGGPHAGRSWLERFGYANEDLALRAGGGAGGGCADFPRAGANLAPLDLIPDYVQDYGFSTLNYHEYFWDATTSQVMRRSPAGDVVTPFGTMLDLYRSELRRSEDVVLLMQGTGPWWWSGSFHVVTGAGVDLTKSSIWFADPDVGRGGMNGWGVPFLNTDPVPDKPPFYTMATFAADGRTFDSGPYNTAFISEIHTLSPVPEPSTLLLIASGLVGLVGVARRRRTQAGRD